ncbi:MAG: extracellular solute-binding protein [Firmicutes bacterium]|nr:extracellular solute-binding protein [Bacillota bacterium]
MNGLKTKIFLFALAVGILSGCKGKIQEQTSGNIQTISLVMDEQYLNGFNQILQEFENSHPNIKVSASSFPAYMEYKRMLYVSSFNSPDTDYDLYCISDSWIYEFAERKYIQPISNISDIALNQFNNQALNMFLISDKLYALPLFMDTWLLYYKDSKTNDREWQNNLADVSLPGINDDSLVEFIMAYKTAKDCSIKDAIEFYKKWYTYRDTKKQNYSNEFTSGTTHYLLAKCVDKNDIENNMTDLNTKIIISQNAEKKISFVWCWSCCKLKA